MPPKKNEAARREGEHSCSPECREPRLTFALSADVAVRNDRPPPNYGDHPRSLYIVRRWSFAMCDIPATGDGRPPVKCGVPSNSTLARQKQHAIKKRPSPRRSFATARERVALQMRRGILYPFILSKNSLLLLVPSILLTRNSIASTELSGLSTRRSAHTFCMTSFSRRRSSLRVPDALMSIAG